ncbi:hypothetical protein K7X08_022881 [Anisodus acutangulus]|uniref:Uncharacterized protein n=1 Tax=Anisodus acutangulus TaxID=402998 RepID=A0A9Q1MBF1_9SOLA|nr:hypothetical protein K7X08_022881 [Anisodus acutangulus]
MKKQTAPEVITNDLRSDKTANDAVVDTKILCLSINDGRSKFTMEINKCCSNLIGNPQSTSPRYAMKEIMWKYTRVKQKRC